MSDIDDPSSGAPPRDVALVGGPTERGDGVTILRLRDGQVEVGELRAAEEGKPILGESVRLHPRAEHPRLFEVETLARGPIAEQRLTDRHGADRRGAHPHGPGSRAARRPVEATRTAAPPGGEGARSKGPARVATDAYRSGWESIFGAPRRGRSLPS
jgi:hypothetical protein